MCFDVLCAVLSAGVAAVHFYTLSALNLHLNCCPEMISIFWVGQIIEATAWLVALVENVAAATLCATQRAIIIIHGEIDKMTTHRTG